MKNIYAECRKSEHIDPWQMGFPAELLKMQNNPFNLWLEKHGKPVCVAQARPVYQTHTEMLKPGVSPRNYRMPEAIYEN